MKKFATISLALGLAVCGGAAKAAIDADKIYAGWLETTLDTTAGGCGGPVGDHDMIQYRPSMTAPEGIWLRHGSGVAYLQSNDLSGRFFTDGTRGKIKGTVVFNAAGPTGLQIGQQTFAGTYTLKVDSTDPVLVKITKMTVKFTLKPSNQVCEFTYNGVMTPALMPAP
jgi:hypothetical protein